MDSTQSLEWVVALQALTTVFVLVLGLVIARFQLHVNIDRLKHERFERRFGMFDATRIFLEALRKAGDLEAAWGVRGGFHGVEKDFLSGTMGARFVFDKNLSEFLEKIQKNARELGSIKEEARELDDTSHKAGEAAKLMNGLNKELDTLENTFSKYF